MNRADASINASYDALLFAKDARSARVAAARLIRGVLGDESTQQPFEEALRRCCRILRPAADPKEQARFEEEFIELAIWPSAGKQLAA
jgi:hypothetical protein